MIERLMDGLPRRRDGPDVTARF